MITYYYGPRQIGKTTLALDRYKIDPDNTAIFFHNHKMTEEVTYNFKKGDIKSSKQLTKNLYSFESNAFRGRDFDTIILDEFDFCQSYQMEKIDALIPICKEIIIYTTPRYLRDRIEYMFMKEYKNRYGCNHSNLIEYCKDIFPEMMINKDLKIRLGLLYGDIITNQNVKLIKLEIPDWSPIKDKKHYNISLGEEAYQTEIEGNIFKII